MAYMDYLGPLLSRKGGGGGYPEPTGSLSIYSNGTYDVKDKAQAVVDVPQPVGSMTIEENGEYDVTDFAQAFVNVGGGGSGEWKRPAEWPDLDIVAESSDFENFVGYYLTYDLDKTGGESNQWGWIGFTTYCYPGEWTIERGTLDENGNFMPADTYYGSKGQAFQQKLDYANGRIQLWRITAPGMTRGGFVGDPDGYYLNVLQPCVEILARVPDINSLATTEATTPSYYDTAACTRWTENANYVDVGQYCTRLDNLAARATSLKKLSIEGDLSGVTTMQAVVENSSVEEVSIMGSLQALTSGSYPLNCFALKSFKASAWNLISLDSSGFTALDFEGCPIVDYEPPYMGIKADISVRRAYKLSLDSIESILKGLGYTSDPRTLTLGNINMQKADPSWIAIASEDGWTVV